MPEVSREPQLVANSIEAIHHRIMELIQDYSPGKALDFPSGWGRLSYWLGKKGYEVTSCDVMPEAYADSPIKHVYGNLNERFPFEDESFDYAFCIEGPEHAENLYHTFREFRRVLKPNGYLILSMPNFSNLTARIKNVWYGVIEPVSTKEDFGKSPCTGHMHINRPSYAMLRMALEAAPFSIVTTSYDLVKKKQMLLYPLYGLIQGITFIKGERGDKRYWLRSSNQKNVLMGGNTLILICRKDHF